MELDEGIPILEEQNGTISNPFISKQTNIDIRYNRILILSSEEDININDASIASFTKDEYIDFCKKLYLLKGHTQMLTNIHHKYNTLIIDYDYLKYINTDIELQQKEIIITLWGFKKDIIKLYIEQYNPNITLERYLLLKKLNTYFNADNGITDFYRSNYLINLDSSNYWVIYNNCKKTITLQFMNRDFKSQIKNIKNKELKDKLLEIENQDDDYLLFMRRDQLYIDISNSINNKGYNKYIISDTSKYSKENITNLITNITNERELYYLVSNLMVSKDLCHLILNNKDVLQILNSNKYFKKKFDKDTTFIKKYLSMIKYCLSYAWIAFYMEESIKKTFIKEDDRFIFDIHTANLLPYFPFISTQPKTSPYFSFLVSDEIADMENNNLTFGCVSMKDRILEYGIIDLKKFKDRLEIFCNINYQYLNIFNNVNWSNIAISGSVIAACLPRINPLMYYFDNNNNKEDIIFEEYINEYYKNSDLDIMCNHESLIDYIKTVYELYETIKTNINNINEHVITKIIQLKSIVVYVSDNFINKKLRSDEFSYEYIIDNFNSNQEIKKIIYNEYICYHFNEMSTYVNNYIFKDDKFNNFFEPVDIVNIKIYKSDRQEKEEEKDIYFYKNIKYKILKNEILRRDIEIFKIKYKEFFSSVSKFHLPCVRAYYTNNNVYILPSCITAMMTFINIDYKYFAGTNNPYDIINKYRSRGFATLLNDTEKINNIQHIVKYTQNNQGVNIINIRSVNKIYGLKTILNLNIYKLSDNLYKINNKLITILNKHHLLVEYNKISNMKEYIFDHIYSHINKYGYINPFKKYILELIFDNS